MMHLQLLKHAVLMPEIRLYCGRLGRLADCQPFTARPETGWVHFFLQDYRFDSVWVNPLRYARRWLHLPGTGLAGLVGFDFSLFEDYPPEVNAWNAYRSALLTDFLSRLIERPALPVASWWSGGDNFRYLQPGTALAVGSYPLKRGSREIYLAGLARLVETVKPAEVHVFGNLPPPEFLPSLPVYRYDLHYHRLNSSLEKKSGVALPQFSS